MPKFYVRSGRFRRVIDRPEAHQAAMAAVIDHAFGTEKPVTRTLAQLGLMTYVSERGFTSKQTTDFQTHYLLTPPRPGPGAE